ncbi:MAG TPA: sulfite exporter TauE/SafE family protein [Burkholderiaceae bacterium]|nr:sulfite exporter TauE/SafE family protein [Burkholderiaceae bacterium]
MALTTTLFSAWLVGLAGGVHCVGMCGGVIGAMSAASSSPPARVLETVALVPSGRAAVLLGVRTPSFATTQAAYHTGRLASYSLVGLIAGGLGAFPWWVRDVRPAQYALYFLSSLVVVMLGLSLALRGRGMTWLERLGVRCWSRLQPLTRHVLPANTTPRAFGLGALWGFVPCGLVYSMLLTAFLSGSLTQGALVMLLFGLGTLPHLLAFAWCANQVRPHLKKPYVRLIAGVAVMMLGLVGITQAWARMDMADAWFCTPSLSFGA